MAASSPGAPAPRPGTSARPLGLIANPAAARGKALRTAERVRRALDAAGVPVHAISAASAQACQQEIRDAASGLRGLVLVGGDGLLGTVLQVEEARAMPIGIVPAGSGNDFARQFDLPMKPEAAVQRLLDALDAPRPVDLGVVLRDGAHAHWFAGGLSIGFDAAINRRANEMRLPIGQLRYVAGLFAEIATLRSRAFEVTAEPAPHAPTEHEATSAILGEATREPQQFTGLLCTVMNIRTLGGGIPITPQAKTDDGALDLIEVAHAPRRRVLRVLGKLAAGRHAGIPEVRMRAVRSVRIDAGDEIAFADGDAVGAGPFTVEVRPGAMQLLA